jgi:uncharacterized protein with HEPN domain
MLSDRARLALFDMRDNIRLCRQFVEGRTLEAFKENRMIFYAVTRALEIVSEASRRLPTSLRERHPQLPWRAIMDVGNVYRHAYDNVAEEYVWRTVTQSFDPLLAVVIEEIERDGAGLG